MSENWEIIRKEIKEHRLALVIGNGINRYQQEKDNCSSKKDDCSWGKVLMDLCTFFLFEYKADADSMFNKLSHTELYDLICLHIHQEKPTAGEIKIVRDKLIEIISQIKAGKIHKEWQNFAKKHNIPILTTNFDSNLEKGLTEYRLATNKSNQKRFSVAYPWDVYYANNSVPPKNSIREQFGVWHINGMLKRKSSIRMGLSNYMGSVSFAGNLIHHKDRSLYNLNHGGNWAGSKTWMDIFFYNSLYIFGLSLDKNEIFLRWLLIERKKFHKFLGVESHDFYIYSKEEETKIPKIFLQEIGITPIPLDNFDAIYNTYKNELA